MVLATTRLPSLSCRGARPRGRGSALLPGLPGRRPRGGRGLSPAGSGVRRLASPLVAAALLALCVPARAQEPPPRPDRESRGLPADSAVVELRPLDVRVSAPSRAGKMTGFHRRRSLGMGSYITRRQIERQDPIRLSDMLRLRAGVAAVRVGDGSGRRRVAIRRATARSAFTGCRVQYWIDGAPLPGVNRFQLDELAPEDVEGIEIYRGPAVIPAQFNRRGSACAVVVIWTRDP